MVINTKYIKTYTLALLCLLISTVALATNITVSTSRNPVSLDDSFHLIYEADSSVDDDPDFSPVYKNFDVLSSSQSTNMRSINGDWSLKKTWNLTLIAKEVGTYTINPVKFGKDISPAIKITVSSSSSSNSTSPSGQSSVPAKIFLDSSIDKKSGWIQSQFVYTIRLLRTVSIANASLSEPTASDADAIIHKLSEDSFTTKINGIQYEVFERRYAIFPQKSGTIKINPITFNGRVNAQQARTIFDQFRISGQAKRIHSKAIEITVKAAPKSVNLQDWLPAGALHLIEEWSDDIQNIKAGDPVTRTISIVAEGLTGVQLPDLQFKDIKNLKQYPDKSIIEDKVDESGVVSIKQIKIALIPASAGNYKLPEIKLQWWNTRTNKQEVAIIPAAQLIVTGNATLPALPPQNTQATTIEKPATNVDKALLTSTPKMKEPQYWKWLTAFFAMAWLFTLRLYFRKNSFNRNTSTINKDKTTPPLKTTVIAVEKAAKNNDAEKTKFALIQWAKVFYEDKTINNLSQIGDYCSDHLEQAMRQLNKTMYSTDDISWNGKELLTIFKEEITKNKKSNNKPSKLKPLYND